MGGGKVSYVQNIKDNFNIYTHHVIEVSAQLFLVVIVVRVLQDGRHEKIKIGYISSCHIKENGVLTE
jgi:hypothetical protein